MKPRARSSLICVPLSLLSHSFFHPLNSNAQGHSARVPATAPALLCADYTLARTKALLRLQMQGADPVQAEPLSDLGWQELRVRLAAGSSNQRDEITLLRNLAGLTRRTLILLARSIAATEHPDLPSLGPTEALTSECVAGLCGTASFDFKLRWDRFVSSLEPAARERFKVSIHQVQSLNPTAGRHGIALVQFPSGNVYLVDLTFRQFFDLRYPNSTPSSIGRSFTATPRGVEFADTLLREGFVLLTPQNWSYYLAQHVAETRPPHQNPEARSPVSDMAHSTQVPEFTPSDWLLQLQQLGAPPP